jgi:NADPH:quinone reductase-like Zn-dependent oxidoreductase
MRGVVFLGERELELRDFPGSLAGAGRSRDRDEGVRHVRQRSARLTALARAGGGMGAALGLGGSGGPVIAGHEPSGVIVARGAGVSETQLPDGARVMNHHYWGLRRVQALPHRLVAALRQGNHGFRRDRPRRTRAVPGRHRRRTMVPLPDSLSFEEGAAISCGTGTAFGALRRMGLNGSHTIAIFGQGPVGLSGTLIAAAMGARVIALDVGAERRAPCQVVRRGNRPRSARGRCGPGD